MALRRRELILAATVAFFSWALITHWLPSIRLVPYALVTGILVGLVAVVILIGSTTRATEDATPNPFPPSTSLSLSHTASWAAETEKLKQRQTYGRYTIKFIPKSLRAPFDGILDLVLRDFVHSWYRRISTGLSFSNQIDNAVRVALAAILERCSKLDLVEVGVTRILPIFIDHMQTFADAERMARGKELFKDVTEHEVMATVARYKEARTLHPAAIANSPTVQQKHLRRIVEATIPKVLPDYMRTSSSVHVIIREIVSCAVLLPLMQMLSDPDFINQMIEAYGRSLLQERKTVQKLRAALDEHSKAPTRRSRRNTLPKLAPNDSNRSFEEFVFAIRHCDTLLDAERFRNDLSRKIVRNKGRQTHDATYVQRLEIGRQLLDQRIVQLASQRRSGQTSDEESSDLTLREVLYDATGLSYFMEYMDRHGLTKCVQFWIIVDGVRNSQNLKQQPQNGRSLVMESPEGQVVAQISNAYMWRPELGVSDETQRMVAAIVSSKSRVSGLQYEQARQAILDAQAHVFDEMNAAHYSEFKRSDLYQKWRNPRLAASQTSLTANGGRLAVNNTQPPLMRMGTGVPVASRSAALKSPDLRRAIASSSDLHSEAKRSERSHGPRRSLDDKSIRQSRHSLDDRNTRKSLFAAEESDVDPLSRSMQSLDSDAESIINEPPQERSEINAVQERLDEIMDESPDSNSLFSDQETMQPRKDGDLERGAIDSSHREDSPIRDQRPSLASLGLVGTPSRRTVFTSDDLFGEHEKMWEEESAADSNADETITAENQSTEPRQTTPSHQSSNADDDIHEAAPGDLGLAELVQSLTLAIDKLEAQQRIVDALTSKAELTGNAAELRILRKSKQSLESEIHRKELQRQQYIVQESDNTLYGKATIAIKNIMVGTEDDGHEFAIYVIEVQRPGSDTSAAASWAIARRYSEFHSLHRRLRVRFAAVANIDFPRRQALLTLQKDFLRKRRTALERYLRELLTHPSICRSIEFRAFLSQQAITSLDGDSSGDLIDRRDLVTRIYNSVTDGMEEVLSNVPMRDQLSLAGQNLITAATSATVSPYPTSPHATTSSSDLTRAPNDQSTSTTDLTSDPSTAREARLEQRALEPPLPLDQPPPPQQPQKQPLIPPIAAAFTAFFQLSHTSPTSSTYTYLRGRALIVILQQLLGTTISRRLRSSYTQLTSPASLLHYLSLLREAVWPGGVLAARMPRTEAERERSRTEAALVLEVLICERVGGVVGRGVARDAAGRWGRCLRVGVLNREVVWRVGDEVVRCVLGVDVDVS
ncbi:MAG: Intermediate filament protein [Chrysothrix sp. TS-e1954]|nr:MAG: Intermediate filament protein [Chrysothrix sp. TS-e1954]